MRTEWVVDGLTIAVEADGRTGQETVWVGARIASRQPVRSSAGHEIAIRDKKARVLFDPGLRSWRLIVEGIDAVPIDAHTSAASRFFADVPLWGWIAVLLCFAMPLATLGGAIPATVGLFAAVGCAGLARSRGSLFLRIPAIVVLVFCCWSVFLMLNARAAERIRALLRKDIVVDEITPDAPCSGERPKACLAYDEFACEAGHWKLRQTCSGRCSDFGTGETLCTVTYANEGEPCGAHLDDERVAHHPPRPVLACSSPNAKNLLECTTPADGGAPTFTMKEACTLGCDLTTKLCRWGR